MNRRGFTIAELAFVLAVMGIIVSVTVPAGELLVRRARADEARALLSAIAHAELQRFRDTGAFLACAAEGEVPKAPVAFPKAECWKTLGIRVDGPVRYRYGVELTPGSFRVVAEGDLDGDGTSARYALDGRTQQLEVVEAYE